MKKFIFFVLTLILYFIRNTYADQSSNYQYIIYEEKEPCIEKKEEKEPCIEEKKEPCIEKKEEKNLCKEEKEDFCSENYVDLFNKNLEVNFITGEFLYFRMDTADLEYVFDYDQSATTGLGTTYGLGDYKKANYDYDPGFRLAFGWFNAPKFWQLYGQFTYLKMNGSGSSSKSGSANRPIVGTFYQNSILAAELNKASYYLRFKHEIGDILISRVFLLKDNPHLRFRIFGGLTGGRLKQVFNVTYTDVNSLNERIFNRWIFFGIGLRTGVDFDWFLTHNIYLTGKMSIASLIGRHKNQGIINADTSGVELQNIKYNKYIGVFNIDTYIGPSFQKSFKYTRMELFLGYELSSWFNVNEIIRPSGATNANALTTEQIANVNRSNVLLHGFVVRVSVDF